MASTAWCYYNNDPANGKKYGKLYNWYAVNDPRGLAPKGWHIPTDSEWTMLTNDLGGDSIAGTKMKNSSGWNDYEGRTGIGTNTIGFAGSPGGYRNFNGKFNGISGDGVWWSSSESDTSLAWGRGLDDLSGKLVRVEDPADFGFSVRCLRDW